MSTNPEEVRATSEAAPRDLINIRNRIAYREVDRLNCLFADMQYFYLN